MLKLIRKSIFMLSLGVGAVSAGESTLDVVTENWAPYNYANQQGKIVGVATEKVRAILKQAGVDYSIAMYPWSRAYNLALHKPNTAIYSIVKTAERTPHFYWFCPIVKVKYYVFKLKGNKNIEINRFDDIKKYVLGLSRGTFFYNLMIKEGHKEGKNFHATSNNLANVRELLHERVQIIADTKENIAIQLQQLGESSDALTAVYHIKHKSIGDNCLAINIKTPKSIINKIDHAFQQYNRPNKAQ